jgi:hypothetical protein
LPNVKNLFFSQVVSTPKHADCLQRKKQELAKLEHKVKGSFINLLFRGFCQFFLLELFQKYFPAVERGKIKTWCLQVALKVTKWHCECLCSINPFARTN